MRGTSDTRIRREVVGQMLDYAANAVIYWPVEEFRSHFNRECENFGIDPDEQLRGFLREATSSDEFWQRAKTNLQAGRIRMIFVADVIPNELKRIVEFLNEQMDPAEVLAVEIKQYLGRDGLRTLVPRVIGQTAEAEKKKGVKREERTWNEELFYEEYAKRHSAELLRACHKLHDIMKQGASHIDFGRGRNDGNIIPFYDDERGRQQIFNLSTNGGMSVTFGHVKSLPFSEESKRRELLARLNKVPGIALPLDSFNRWPSFKLNQVVEKNGLDDLMQVVKWAIGKIIETRNAPAE